MPLRKLLLRIMLAALGLTAVAGAIAALTGGSDAGWKIVATALTAAVAAGLMIPFSLLADRQKTQLVGLIGMALVAVEFVASLALIWDLLDAVGSNRFSENIGVSMFFLALVALPSLFFLWLAGGTTSRIAGIAGVVLGAAVFTMLMIGTWIGGSFWQNDEWLGTASATAGLGLLGVFSLAGVGTPPARWWRWVGVAAATVATASAIYAIWKEPSGGERLFLAIVSVAVILAHANLCLLVPLSGWQRWIRIATIGAAILTALMINVLAANENAFAVAGNLAAAAGIIAACGSLALIVLAAVNRRGERRAELSEIKELTLICPGCQKKQPQPVGDSRCTTCGLQFSIKITEPRCPKCDYLLYMLKSDRCPECGTGVGGT